MMKRETGKKSSAGMLLKVVLATLLLGGFLNQARGGSFYSSDLLIKDLDGVAQTEEERKANDLMWRVYPGGAISGTEKASEPAKTTLKIPSSGKYYVWVCYQVHKLRAKPFCVHLQGHELPFAWLPFGETKEDRPEFYGPKEVDRDFIWTRVELTLSAGSAQLTLTAGGNIPDEGKKAPRHPPVIKDLIVTADPAFDPSTN